MYVLKFVGCCCLSGCLSVSMCVICILWKSVEFIGDAWRDYVMFVDGYTRDMGYMLDVTLLWVCICYI